jgi:hypothetical protein
VAEALRHQLFALHRADAVVEQAVDRQAHHVLERDRALALLEERRAVHQLEQRQRHAAHLARHRIAHVVAVHHAGLHERLAEAAAVGAHQRGDAVEILLGDAAVGDHRLAEAVAPQVAGREHQPAVVEEGDLDHAARAHLQVAGPALARQAADRLGDRALGDVGQHPKGLLCTLREVRQAASLGARVSSENRPQAGDTREAER